MTEFVGTPTYGQACTRGVRVFADGVEIKGVKSIEWRQGEAGMPPTALMEVLVGSITTVVEKGRRRKAKKQAPKARL